MKRDAADDFLVIPPRPGILWPVSSKRQKCLRAQRVTADREVLAFLKIIVDSATFGVTLGTAYPFWELAS